MKEPTPGIIPKQELKEGFYRGHPKSRYPVAYWDPRKEEFISLCRKFEAVVTKHMNHWDDEACAAFGPVEYLERE